MQLQLTWFAVYSTTLSQLLHFMATPYIFLFKQKILTKHLLQRKKTNLT